MTKQKVIRFFTVIKIHLGITPRYWYDGEEVLIYNSKGAPIDSYIKRTKIDRLKQTESDFTLNN